MEMRNLVAAGDNDGVAENLGRQQLRLLAVADKLGKMESLGIRARVVPNICSATARHLKITQLNRQNPIEVMAFACRMTFELNLELRYVMLSDGNLDDFAKRRATEEIDFLNAFCELADSAPQLPNGDRTTIQGRIGELNQLLEKWGDPRPSGTGPQVRAMAVATGVLNEYQRFYRFYSKYVHASSWLVNAPYETLDDEKFRIIFSLQTQLYAGDTCSQAEKLAEPC